MRRAGLGVLLVVLLLVGLAQTSVGTSVARTLGLASSTERYTELYFADQAAISAASQGSDSQAATTHVSFVIANRESRPMTYHWQISSAGTQRASGTVAVAASGSTTVSPAAAVTTGCQFKSTETRRVKVKKVIRVKEKKGHKAQRKTVVRYETRTVRVSPRRTGPSQSKITISLTTPKQSIDYWMACRA